MAKGRYVAMQIARNLGLCALSVACLPISLSIMLLAQVAMTLSVTKDPKGPPVTRNKRQVRVLVTGVGMAKGLFLARSLHVGGCSIVAADFEKHGVPVCGRFSKTIDKFYSLRIPTGNHGIGIYIDQVLGIIKEEKIDLWVSCSGVATALEDARLMQRVESETSCKAYQFNEDATFKLDNKYEFMRTTASFGLPVPQWGSLTCPGDAENVVRGPAPQTVGAHPHEFILKNVAMDDRTRGALPLLSADRPKQMGDVLDSLDYHHASWIMQQYIPGSEEYCTQSLVVDGHVRAFLACPSASILMHYEVLDATSPLFQAMLRFTQTYATGMYAKYGHFSGHLSFDFLAFNEPTVAGMKKTLLPIECNPRCHTAVVHFRGHELALTTAYLSLLPPEKGSSPYPYVPDLLVGNNTKESSGYYWIAHDLIVLGVLPLLQFLFGSGSLKDLTQSHFEFWKHITLWKDPTFEWWDPLPWFVLNHIYWPGQLVSASWSGTRWSQINVSTGKMFVM
ncbi:MAG: hypothetical protein LQ340_002876 [Diploschistes diacapsis]|nr:MAG: hypothetical protein LQ340_002876 [Diploschistes diacapsis]